MPPTVDGSSISNSPTVASRLRSLHVAGGDNELQLTTASALVRLA